MPDWTGKLHDNCFKYRLSKLFQQGILKSPYTIQEVLLHTKEMYKGATFYYIRESIKPLNVEKMIFACIAVRNCPCNLQKASFNAAVLPFWINPN